MSGNRATIVAVLGAGALGVAALAFARRPKDVTTDRAHASRTVTIRGDAELLYAMWKSDGGLPEVFRGEHNVAITDDEPGRRLAWRTVKAMPFKGGGSLTFATAPGGRGTEARLSVYLEGPGSRTISAFNRLFGGSLQQIAMESLRQFKSLAEAGEIPKAVRS